MKRSEKQFLKKKTEKFSIILAATCFSNWRIFFLLISISKSMLGGTAIWQFNMNTYIPPSFFSTGITKRHSKNNSNEFKFHHKFTPNNVFSKIIKGSSITIKCDQKN